MVVDDHELVRRGLAALVNAESDMQCCREVACQDAVDAVKSCRPDVVVIDVSISRGDGFKLIQRIRKIDDSVRIVALAMTDKPEFVEKSVSAGAVACVMKMDLAARVLAAIRRTRLPRNTNAPFEVPAGKSARPVSMRGDRSLDPVEREIVEMIGRGVPSRAIAVRLGLSLGAVEVLRRRIRSKLNFPTATQLVQFCVRCAARDQVGAAGAVAH